MNITCDIIRDLLPLYAEDLVSEDSKKLVDGHLCQCDPCTKVLASLKKDMPLPVEGEPDALNKVKKMILRRRWISVLASLLTLVTLASFGISYLFAPFQLTKEQALDDFYIEDGQVCVLCSPASQIMLRNFSAPHRLIRGENLTGGQFKLRDCCTDYIRAEIVDAQGRRAWTNPIFLD